MTTMYSVYEDTSFSLCRHSHLNIVRSPTYFSVGLFWCAIRVQTSILPQADPGCFCNSKSRFVLSHHLSYHSSCWWVGEGLGLGFLAPLSDTPYAWRWICFVLPLIFRVLTNREGFAMEMRQKAVYGLLRLAMRGSCKGRVVSWNIFNASYHLMSGSSWIFASACAVYAGGPLHCAGDWYPLEIPGLSDLH